MLCFFRKSCLLTLLFISLQSTLSAQQKTVFTFGRFSVENDFINFRGEGTDRGYTSGLQLAFYYRKPHRHFVEKLLMPLSPSAENLYSYALTQKLFTPDDISDVQIQYNDRPYAAVLYVTNQLSSSDAAKGVRLTTELSGGALGAYAFGRQTQNFIHKMVHYKYAQGWANEIASDVVLNYGLRYEQRLARVNSSFELIGQAKGNVGTLYNNMGTGLLLRVGLLNNYFVNDFASNESPSEQMLFRQFHIYLFMQSCFSLVMNDATLEGGFFTHNQSVYRIDKDDINRFCQEYRCGLVIEKMPFRLVISQTVQSAEFKNSYAQQAGNVSIQFGLGNLKAHS